MATSRRRGDGAGKEKKAIPPSTSSTTTKKTTRPLTSSISSSHGDKKTVSSSTTRQTPSHLRPTRSTPNEPSRLSKKPITEPSNTKPLPPRRRSFGHPPPPSHVQKAIRDAKNSRSATTLKNTIKSASPSARPSSSDKPVKNEVKPLSISPSLRKNSALSSTPMTSSTSPSKETWLIKKATKSSMFESNPHINGISSDIDDPFAIENDLVSLDNDDVQSLPEISEMPVCSSVLGDPDTFLSLVIEVENSEILNMEDGHEPDENVLVVNNHVADEPTTQDTPFLDDIQIESKQLEDQNNVEIIPTNQEEENQIVEDIDNQGVVDQEIENDESKETLSEVKKEDESPKKEEEDKEKEEEIKTERNTKNDKIEAKTSTKSAVANVVSRSESMVKKENQQAYNDVIEQTASKLRSKKNKVLALAGAFETVISLQDKN